MSNSFIDSFETELLQGILTGALSGSITTGLQNFISDTPAATLADAESYVDSNINILLNDAISKIPAWEQPVVEIFEQAELSKISAWANSLIEPIYNKLITKV